MSKEKIQEIARKKAEKLEKKQKAFKTGTLDRKEFKKAYHAGKEARRQDIKCDPLTMVADEISRSDLPQEARQWQVHAVMAQLGGAKTYAEIGRLVGKNKQTVSGFLVSETAEKIRNSVVGDDFLREMRKRVRLMAGRSLEVVSDMLYSDAPEKEDKRLKLALDILDRAGVRESEKKEVKHVHILEGIKEAIARASKKEEQAARQQPSVTGNA